MATRVYVGWYWLKVYDENIVYHGGEIRNIRCLLEELFDTLANCVEESLNVHNVWYKLPFEEMNERNIVCVEDVEDMKTMYEAATWTSAVHVFIVNKVQHPTDVIIDEGCCLVVDVNVKVVESEGDDFDYHITAPNSDGEVDDTDIVRCKRGSGVLKLQQVLDALDDFKEALVDYVLKEGWNIVLSIWGKEISEARCNNDACAWRIYYSYEKPVGKWMVKQYDDKHSCSKENYSRILNIGVIAKLLIYEIRVDLELKPKYIQDQILKWWKLFTTLDKSGKAKKKALQIIEKEHEEQFSRLKDYRTELLRSNEGFTIDLEMFFSEGGSGYFRRMYMCFDVIRKTWRSWCRPIFGLDACFLKCILKGKLLVAVGRDANNGMYPIAWAVVDVENEDNWFWFIHKLKGDLDLEDGLGFTLISDRQKGLLNVVARELLMVEHRMCPRHIYENLKKLFSKQHDMKKMFENL